MWRITSSCVSMYKQGKKCSDPAASSELCCTTEDKQVFANVWSYISRGGSDSMLTENAGEAAQLSRNGSGWHERCSPVPGPTVFCYNASLLDGRDGPFMLYSREVPDVETRPLHRCKAAGGGSNFFSVEKGCEGRGAADRVLGRNTLILPRFAALSISLTLKASPWQILQRHAAARCCVL